MVLENGVSIPAVFWQEQGMIVDFGTLVLQRHQAPCQWKRVRDIATTQLPRIGFGGIGLVYDDQ